jgi:hypothetical protein
MGTNVDHLINERPGPYVFKINGYCHHLMGSFCSMIKKHRNLLSFISMTQEIRSKIDLRRLSMALQHRLLTMTLFIGL